MVDRLRLSRAQLAKIVGNDAEAIKQFERLFQQSDTQETGVDEVVIAAGIADNKANQALDQLQRIADALEVLALAPVDDVDAGVVDIAPPVVPSGADDPLTPPVQWVAPDDFLIPPPRQLTAKRYGSFYSTATQVATLANTAYAVSLNTTSLAFGVSVASSSRITPDNGGLFLLDYALHIHETSGGTANAYSWIRINGTDVAYSGVHTQIQGNGAQRAGSGRHLLRLNRGDYVEVMWAADTTTLELDTDAASAFAPACASARVTITDNLEEM